LALLKNVQTGFDSTSLYSMTEKQPGREVLMQRKCGATHLRPHRTPYAFMGWTLVLLQPGSWLCFSAQEITLVLLNFTGRYCTIYLPCPESGNKFVPRKKVSEKRQSVRKDPQPTC